MMIPTTIDQIRTAFKTIKLNGIPTQRKEQEYRVSLEGEYYTVPVKYLISVVTGLYPEQFVTNEALSELKKHQKNGVIIFKKIK